MADPDGVVRTKEANQLKIAVCNGIPFVLFLTQYKPILDIELSKKADDGFTFLAVAHRKDMGGNNFVPPGPVNQVQWAITPDQLHKHSRRVARLSEIIMSILDIHCDLYRMYTSPDWIGQGVLIYEDFCASMQLTMDTGTLSKLTTQWVNLTWKSTGEIKLDRNTLYRWKECVNLAASKFPAAHVKTDTEIWEKFCTGCPTEIITIVAQHLTTPMNKHMIPQNFGQRHPRAGNPNPLAGQKCITLLVADLNIPWLAMIKNGVVHCKDEHHHEQMFWVGSDKKKRYNKTSGSSSSSSSNPRRDDSKSKFTPTLQTVCYACGGLAHMAKVKKNGVWVANCPTTIKIEKETLIGMKYPHMENPRHESAHEVDVREGADGDGEQCNEVESDDDVEKENLDHVEDDDALSQQFEHMNSDSGSEDESDYAAKW